MFGIRKSKSEENTARWLIAGLGNPGPKYSLTWHNAGYMCIDMLSQRHSIPADRIKFKGLYGQGTIMEKKIILLKPSTYMNNSGESLKEAMSFFRIPPEKTIVIYDDIDIELGKVRTRKSGGPGTHNGMRSVTEHLGTENFPRIRVGIGPLPEHYDIAEYVLSGVPEENRDTLFDSLVSACKAAEELLSDA